MLRVAIALCLAVVLADQQLWERSDRISRRPVRIADDGAFSCEASADTRHGDGDDAADAEQLVVDPLDEIASEFASLPRRQLGRRFREWTSRNPSGANGDFGFVLRGRRPRGGGSGDRPAELELVLFEDFGRGVLG